MAMVHEVRQGAEGPAYETPEKEPLTRANDRLTELLGNPDDRVADEPTQAQAMVKLIETYVGDAVEGIGNRFESALASSTSASDVPKKQIQAFLFGLGVGALAMLVVGFLVGAFLLLALGSLHRP